MTAYTLRDVGLPYKKCTSGRKWIGRVGPCEDGRWFGKIGKTFVYAATEADAFGLVVAQHCGYPTAAAMAAHTSAVRAANRHTRAAARHVASEFLAGNAAPFMNLLDKATKGD